MQVKTTLLQAAINFNRPPELHAPNGTSIGLTAFARLTLAVNRHKETNTLHDNITGNNKPHSRVLHEMWPNLYLNRCVARVYCKSARDWTTAAPWQLHTDGYGVGRRD